MKPSRKKTKQTVVPAAVVAVAERKLPFAGPVRDALVRFPRHAFPLAALWIAALLCYSNAFHGALVSESAARIVQDTRVHAATKSNIGLIFKSDYRPPAADRGGYRPLTTLSFLLNYAVLRNAARPFSYHLINWVLHAINIMLVYLLALRIFKRVLTSFGVAMLWSVHPVLTEAVTNVAGRADLFAGMAILGALLCYIRAAEGSGRQSWTWMAGATLITLLGMFANETTVIVPVAAILYSVTVGVVQNRRAQMAKYTILALPCVIYGIVHVWVFRNVPGVQISLPDNPIANAGWITAKLTAFKVIGMELWLLVWPAHLSYDYSYNQIPLFSGADWFPVAACLGLAAVGLAAYRRNQRLVAFWIAFFFLALAPTANLLMPIGTPMAERFLYVPAVGLAGCLVALTSLLRRDGRAVAGLILLAVPLGIRTYTRNADWADENSLWASAVSASPASFKTHMSLAVANPAMALAEIDKAIAIVSTVPDELNTPVPYIQGGKIYREAGDKLVVAAGALARDAFRKALKLLSKAESIGQARERRDGHAHARSSPEWIQYYQEMGRVYGRLSEFDKGLDILRTGLKQSLAPELFEELSVTYFRMRDPNRAAIALNEGLLIWPRNGKVARELAGLYSRNDAARCAFVNAGGSPTLNIGCPIVQENVCAASVNVAQLYRDIGQPGDANRIVRRAMDSLKCGPELFNAAARN